MFSNRGRPAEPDDDDRESPDAGPPGFVDAPGVTLERIGRLFAAAADFYRSAPWRRVGDNVPIEFRFPADGGEPRYCIVMGGGGAIFGLAFYHSLADFALEYSADDPEKTVRAFDHEAVTFGDAADGADSDLAAAKQHGWEVAGPNAYPAPLIVDRRGELRPPSLVELDRYEAAFRAIPTFVEKHMLSETGELRMAEATLSVPVGVGGRVGETEAFLRFPPGRKPGVGRGAAAARPAGPGRSAGPARPGPADRRGPPRGRPGPR